MFLWYWSYSMGNIPLDNSMLPNYQCTSWSSLAHTLPMLNNPSLLFSCSRMPCMPMPNYYNNLCLWTSVSFKSIIYNSAQHSPAWSYYSIDDNSWATIPIFYPLARTLWCDPSWYRRCSSCNPKFGSSLDCPAILINWIYPHAILLYCLPHISFSLPPNKYSSTNRMLTAFIFISLVRTCILGIGFFVLSSWIVNHLL